MGAQFPVIVIGSGPTGIGAATRLSELDVPWIMLERESYAGGLAASFFSEGYTWDIGGHVIFSHYDAYDEFLLRSIPEAHWLDHPRNAQVRFEQSWVPYPFQLNLEALPEPARSACVEGMRRVQDVKVDTRNFAAYIDTHFGEGIAQNFMRPYNEKIWAHPLDRMGVGWIGERVASVRRPGIDVNKSKAKQSAWGPNNQFRFPMQGGTGEIWRNAANLLEHSCQRYQAEVTAVHPDSSQLELADGERLGYSAVISTMPLDVLAKMTLGAEGESLASGLHYSSVQVVGLGLSGEVTPEITDTCWMYFPDPAVPFYRATVFSRYSPNNVPAGHWSLMLEISESNHRPVKHKGLIDRCVDACLDSGLIVDPSKITHRWQHRAKYGYPVPTLDRDSSVSLLRHRLEEKQIFSRGRFGFWMYEIGNMDHSYMQGREVADRIILQKPEVTIDHPDRINQQGAGRQ